MSRVGQDRFAGNVLRHTLRPAAALALACAVAGSALAQQDVPPRPVKGQPPLVKPRIPKPKLPETSPFLSSPRPPAGVEDRSDFAVGDGVNLIGHLGAGPDDGTAPSEPSAFKTKRTAIVPRGEDEFTLGKHALSDGVTVGISLDLPSLGGN
jgi:hypothetical protein